MGVRQRVGLNARWMLVLVLLFEGVSCSPTGPSFDGAVDAPDVWFDLRYGTDWWRGPCTIDECEVWEDKKEAACGHYYTPGQPPDRRICCLGPVVLMARYACDPTGARCYRFIDGCVPGGWSSP